MKVENLKNGRSVVVRINDRGPFVGGRIIDLTKAAARKLGFISSGTAKVRLTVLASELDLLNFRPLSPPRGHARFALADGAGLCISGRATASFAEAGEVDGP